MVSSRKSSSLVVSTRDLDKSFSKGKRDSVRILRGINLEVDRGSFVSIVGPSGSGKSTLLYCLSGLEPLTKGELVLCGEELSGASRKKRSDVRRKHASFVFQDYNLISSMTVTENIRLAAKFTKVNLPKRRISDLLDRFGLNGKGRSYPSELSGGQRQRVALVRALAVNADVVFADEPTGALDSNSSRTVLDELHSLTKRGKTVVIVTHDLEIAARTDRSLVLADGEIIADRANASADELLAYFN